MEVCLLLGFFTENCFPDFFFLSPGNNMLFCGIFLTRTVSILKLSACNTLGLVFSRKHAIFLRGWSQFPGWKLQPLTETMLIISQSRERLAGEMCGQLADLFFYFFFGLFCLFLYQFVCPEVPSSYKARRSFERPEKSADSSCSWFEPECLPGWAERWQCSKNVTLKEKKTCVALLPLFGASVPMPGFTIRKMQRYQILTYPLLPAGFCLFLRMNRKRHTNLMIAVSSPAGFQ